jgi:hypothetical protein
LRWRRLAGALEETAAARGPPGPLHAFIAQSHRPGAEAEVDFGDVKVCLAGEQVTCVVFPMRLS